LGPGENRLADPLREAEDQIPLTGPWNQNTEIEPGFLSWEMGHLLPGRRRFGMVPVILGRSHHGIDHPKEGRNCDGYGRNISHRKVKFFMIDKHLAWRWIHNKNADRNH
jgi:hypothetical protein